MRNIHPRHFGMRYITRVRSDVVILAAGGDEASSCNTSISGSSNKGTKGEKEENNVALASKCPS